MGVLPLQFVEGTSTQTLELDGSESYSLTGLSEKIEPGQMVTLEITRKDDAKQSVPVKLRIDTPIEIDYYRHGGILPFVLRELISRGRS
jgi:aconitate hydratase